MILAIDPGKEKCGLAVLHTDGRVIEQVIWQRLELAAKIPLLLAKYRLKTIIIGHSAFGRELERELMLLGLKVNLIFISEKDSTRQAREKYWQAHPPQGWWKMIPTSLRFPPVPIDDFAAIVIGLRYLNPKN